MGNSAYRQCQLVQKAVESDREYAELNRLRQLCEADYRQVIQTLSPQQHQIITEYIGICAEMTERIVELACFCQETE